MPSQTQPAVTHNISPLERCAPEILERIVLFAVKERLIGPPSDLLALLTTSKAINFALSPDNNNNLCASIFTLKFDTAAASRRFGPRWLTTRSLAAELRHRFEGLKRIRSGIIDGPMLRDDLWTVFFILLEHDRKNVLQLTEWARAHTFAHSVADRWLNGGYGPGFDEDAGGLVCRIIWELVREGQLHGARTALDDCFDAKVDASRSHGVAATYSPGFVVYSLPLWIPGRWFLPHRFRNVADSRRSFLHSMPPRSSSASNIKTRNWQGAYGVTRLRLCKPSFTGTPSQSPRRRWHRPVCPFTWSPCSRMRSATLLGTWRNIFPVERLANAWTTNGTDSSCATV